MQKPLTPEQIKGLAEYEENRKQIIERVLAKEQNAKQLEVDARKSKKRGVKKT